LRPRHQRPSRRAAQPRNEIAPFHSITLSARWRIDWDPDTAPLLACPAFPTDIQ
jgi:hypothetical protein